MIQSIKYKNTGLEWCPQIPEHWELKKLKYVALVQPSNVDKKSEKEEVDVKLCNYVDVYKNDYITEGLSFMEATAKKSEIDKYKLIVGDVIITKDSESPQDIAIPAYVKSTIPNLLCGYHLAQIRSNNINIVGGYLFRLFQSKMFNTNFEIGANGITRYGLGLEVTQSTYVPLPPLTEQEKIADYLDRKTTLIDSIISKKEKQIELYKEERIAVINQAVTKGLNPDVEMKDSGIEWLGSIPKHWEVKKLKYLGEAIIGITYSLDEVVDDLGLLVLRASNVQNGVLTFDNNVYLNKEVQSKYLTRKGDILICARNGSAHLVGKSAYIDDIGINLTFGAFMLIFRSLYGKFMYYIFNSNLFKYQTGMFKTVTINQLTANAINNMSIAIPKLDEIGYISDFLDNEINRIDTLVSKTSKQIELLKEYKEALINEVVTGQRIIN